MMNRQDETATVGQLVLARLLVAGEKGATVGELKKALEPLLGHRWAGAVLADRLSQALDALAAAGLIARIRKGRTDRGTITPRGRRQSLEFLGLEPEQVPPALKWDTIKKSYLSARALGLPAPRDKAVKLFGGEPGFKAALLKAQFDLPTADYPTFDQALDALAWTLLGFEPAPGTKFSAVAVKAALLRHALDGQRRVDPRADPKKEATKLLARRLGARTSGRDELRLAAIRQWIDRGDGDGVPESTRRPSAIAGSPGPPDLDTFARRVCEAARTCPTGRFGDNKVFVVHVWRALRAEPDFATMGLDEFKRRLAEANNARRLDLGRADLVEAMDPEDVALSTVSYLGAEFHFVRIG